MKRITYFLIIALGMMACQNASQTQTPAQPVSSSDFISTPSADNKLEDATDNHRIEVTINNYKGDKLFLANYYGTGTYLQDTATVDGGTFVFEADQPLEKGIYLVAIPPQNNYFEIIVDADQVFSVETDSGDMAFMVSNMKIDGSKQNEVFYQDLNFLSGMRNKVVEIDNKIKELEGDQDAQQEWLDKRAAIDDEVLTERRKLAESHPGFLYSNVVLATMDAKIPPSPTDENGNITDSLFAFKFARGHYFDGMNFLDDRLIRTPVMQSRVVNFLDRLTYRMPDSLNASIDMILAQAKNNPDVYQFLISTILNKYAESKIMVDEGVYVHMVEKYYLSGEAFWADSTTLAKMEERARAISPNLVGRTAPNFVAQDGNNQPRPLHDIPGEYVILYFWDYDCGHCKKETPKLAKAYKRYQDKGVTLFTVSINGDVEVWKEKLGEYDLDVANAINVQDHYRRSGFDKMYDVLSTPRLFVLDKDKKIMAKRISTETMVEILDRELGLEPEPKEEETEEAE